MGLWALVPLVGKHDGGSLGLGPTPGDRGIVLRETARGSRERARRGRPPHAPPPITLGGSFWLVLLVNLLIFWDRIACNLLTLFLIFFHVIILHDHRFFSEVPPFEESQDPSNSPRREEVGRRTLGAFGGLLPAFFYRARFQLFTQHFLVFVEKPQKLSLRSL